MSIRTFQWQDIPELTALENAIQTEDGSCSSLDKSWLEEYFNQPNLDVTNDCFVYEADDEVKGYALISPEASVRRAVLELKVYPDIRNQGIEQALIERTICRASTLGADVLHIQVDQSSHLPGILQRLGFKDVRVYLDMRWDIQPFPSPQAPPNFIFRKYGMPEDSTILANIQNSAFGGSWGFSPNTPEEINYRVGMRITGPDSIIFLCNGDKVTGYNWTLALKKHSTLVGVISMIGIDPDYRNQRLGRPLLHAGLEYLVSLGVEYVELEVDQSNAAAIRLYHSVGFQEIQQRHWYEVSISNRTPPID